MNRIHRGKRQRPKRQGGPKRKPGKKNSGGRRSRRQTNRLGLQHRSQDRGPNGCPRLALRNGGRCSSGGPNGPVRLRDTVDAVAARLKVHLGNGPASLVPQIEARARYRRVCLKDRRDERQIRPATSPPFAAFAMLTPSSTQIGLVYVCRSNADKAKLVRPESCRQ